MVNRVHGFAIHQSLERILYGIRKLPAWTYIYTALADHGLRKLYDNHFGFILWLRDGRIDLGRNTSSVSKETVADVAFRLCQAAYYTDFERGAESELTACSKAFGDSYKRVDDYAKSLIEFARQVRAGVLRACVDDMCMEQLQAELLLKTPSVAVYRAQNGLVELTGLNVVVKVSLGGRSYKYYISYPQIARYPCFTSSASGLMLESEGILVEFPSQSEVKSKFPRALRIVGELLRDAVGSLADVKCGLMYRCMDLLPWAVDYGYMTVDELVQDSAVLISQLAYKLFAEGELS
ncbi:MAG: hypothetical protein QW230_04565 [Thermofilum sp.]